MRKILRIIRIARASRKAIAAPETAARIDAAIEALISRRIDIALKGLEAKIYAE